MLGEQLWKEETKLPFPTSALLEAHCFQVCEFLDALFSIQFHRVAHFFQTLELRPLEFNTQTYVRILEIQQTPDD